MTSIFAREEIGSLHPLTDEAACRAADIRGPFRKWRLSGSVSCGAFTSINGALNARGTVRIGRYCAFGQDLSLVSGNHRLDMPNTQMWLARRHGFAVPTETKGPIEIGHNVWIGDKVIVLSGVTVGHGAVIGAGAVVTKTRRAVPDRWRVARPPDPHALHAGRRRATARHRMVELARGPDRAQQGLLRDPYRAGSGRRSYPACRSLTGIGASRSCVATSDARTAIAVAT